MTESWAGPEYGAGCYMREGKGGEWNHYAVWRRLPLAHRSPEPRRRCRRRCARLTPLPAADGRGVSEHRVGVAAATEGVVVLLPHVGAPVASNASAAPGQPIGMLSEGRDLLRLSVFLAARAFLILARLIS